jgi:LmbE family N-acetylglucosaminyl deacetylase
MNGEAQLIPLQASALPVMEGPWLVFAPHPDDESFGMGGALALAKQFGIATHLVVVTDGALGGTGADLVQIRKHEAHTAAALLGITTLHFLDQPDRGLAPNAALFGRIEALLTTIKPRAVFFPGVFELHPDHRACALLVWEALRRHGDQAMLAVAYEITAQSPVNCLVDITAVMPLKQQAIAAYRSQHAHKDYGAIEAAFNRVRSLTLGTEVEWAEGFWVYSREERKLTLSNWLHGRAQIALENHG